MTAVARHETAMAPRWAAGLPILAALLPAQAAALPTEVAVLPILAAALPALTAAAVAAPATPPHEVVVQGDGIASPLTATPGDPARGRTIVADRRLGLCLLCHRGPFPEERFQGTLATDLTGAGARWNTAQLRLRIVDSRRLSADSPMPAYYRTSGLQRVGAAWAGRTILDAQQVEDVVAFLATLRDRAEAAKR